MTDIFLTETRLSNFVERQIKSSFYYSPAWLDLITGLYGYTLIPLTTIDTDGQITGFLPLCSVRSPLTGRHLVALPFSDYCPLLAIDDASSNELIDKAIDLAQQEKVKYLELRTGTSEVLAKRSDFVGENLYVRWLLPLTVNANTLWKGLKKNVRYEIKKSQKLGVQVHVAQNREDMVHYYRLHLLTRSKKHGMPAQPEHFFFALWDAFASNGTMQLLLAEYEGTIIGGMILFASGKTMRYAYGASDERYLHLAPNNLLMWTAIAWSCEQGYQTFDMGRTACANEGLMGFKRRWGAVEEPLPYYYYPQVTGLSTTPENSWQFRLLTTCWKQLPLQVAGPLGGYLYKHLG